MDPMQSICIKDVGLGVVASTGHTQVCNWSSWPSMDDGPETGTMTMLYPILIGAAPSCGIKRTTKTRTEKEEMVGSWPGANQRKR